MKWYFLGSEPIRGETVDSNTWDRVGELFMRALELPPDARSKYLDEACLGQADTRAEVDALLAGHGQSGSDDPALLLPSSGGRLDSLAPGAQVGPYRLDELIGRGGMGEVFRASRSDDQFRQRVAIKVVRAERSSPELVRRFLQERQIMATLDHPNIVPLLDGGLGPAGQPYLVMPFVEGRSITQFVLEERTSLVDRLRLFVTVCQAVQFAHRHLIVHRDLKPSNILVDAQGTPRLLDFGIAKLLDPTAATSTTGDLLLLTPEHAAPEQFLGQQVTTATDVYALGILLYELLTGTRPFREVPATELPRAVCEQPPAPPSAVRPVDADLDQITLMALRKEPTRRYVSAGQLAEDVTRYLGGWPVIARPDTAKYRLQRFVARNRTGVIAAGAIAASLAAATGWSAWQSARRTEALRVAEKERARASRITDFLLGVFQATNPNETGGRTVTARELLDQATGRIDADLATDPASKADLQLAMGRAYLYLGLPKTAESLLTQATGVLRTTAADRPLELAAAMEWQSHALAGASKLPESIEVMKQVIATRERLIGPNTLELVRPLRRLATALHEAGGTKATADSALTLANRALANLEAADSGRTLEAAETHRIRAWMTQWLGQKDEAVAISKQALAIARATVKDEGDPKLFLLRQGLANAVADQGGLDTAIAMLRGLIADERRVYGNDNAQISWNLWTLATLLQRAGRTKEGLPVIEECIAIREKWLGPNHFQTGRAWMSYGNMVADTGDLNGSIAAFRRAARIFEQTQQPTNENVMTTYEAIAVLQVWAGRRAEAIETLGLLVDRGFQKLDREDFAPLKTDPRFRALLARAGRPATETR